MLSGSCGFLRASGGLGGSATVSEKLEEKEKILYHKHYLPYSIVPHYNMASRNKSPCFGILNYKVSQLSKTMQSNDHGQVAAKYNHKKHMSFLQ